MLTYYESDNPKILWEQFVSAMSEDYVQSNINSIDIKHQVLQHLTFMLESMGKNINDYNLVNYTIILSEDEKVMKEIMKNYL